MEVVLDREARRLAAEADVETLLRVAAADDLDPLVAWTALGYDLGVPLLTD